MPEQQAAAKKTAKAIADFVKEDYQIIISHSNGPQIGMIHTAMSEFCKIYPEYTATPMSVCSAMSQGYIGYDLQNAIRTELLNRGIYKPVATVLTQMTVDPYDDAFYHPTKIIGRIMSAEEAEAEEKKGNHVVEVEGGYRRIVSDTKANGNRRDRYHPCIGRCRSGSHSLWRRWNTGTCTGKPFKRSFRSNRKKRPCGRKNWQRQWMLICLSS